MTNTTFPTGGIAVSTLSGDETVLIGPGATGSNTSPQNLTTTTQMIADLASVTSNNLVQTNLNTVGAGTITAAGIVGGISVRGGAQAGAAFTDTTATAALIIAALPAGAPVGTSFLWTIENTTDADETLAGGVGVTISGNLIVPKLTAASYLVKYTAAATVTITFVCGMQLSPLPYQKSASDGVTNSATVGIAGLTGAQINNLALSGTHPGSIKLPTAVDWIAATPNARVGLATTITIANVAVTSTQLTGLVGTTIAGTASIDAGSVRTFGVLIASLGSVQLTSISQSQI